MIHVIYHLNMKILMKFLMFILTVLITKITDSGIEMTGGITCKAGDARDTGYDGKSKKAIYDGGTGIKYK